jgi:maleate isomerase
VVWRPDGWDATVRVGVLVPHADVGPESELAAMAPAGVAVHAARVPFGAMAPGGAMDPTIALEPVREFAAPPHIDAAAELLAAAPLDAIGVGFTSHAYLIGAEAEAAMVRRLERATRGIPVVSTGLAFADALRALGARRVMLVHPPWFDAGLADLGRAYLEAMGAEVLVSVAAGLPSDQRAITPEGLHDRVAGEAPPGAEAVVIGGNGFRAVGAIEALEATLAVPVVTANQALLWALMRAAGADAATVGGHGRLFRAG